MYVVQKIKSFRKNFDIESVHVFISEICCVKNRKRILIVVHIRLKYHK